MTLLATLPESQAGPGLQRHKCCACAYREGFDAGAILADIPHGDEMPSVDTFYEGALKTVTVNAYERTHARGKAASSTMVTGVRSVVSILKRRTGRSDED
jgi:hypothetical protein